MPTAWWVQHHFTGVQTWKPFKTEEQSLETCYLLKRKKKKLWLGLFFRVRLLPVVNLAFCLIIHFRKKDENISVPAALLSPPACADILHYPLLAPWLVIQHHNKHTSHHQATPVWFLSKPLLLKVCQQRVERQKQNTSWLSNGEFLLERTVVSWKWVLNAIQATMAFYWVFNSSAKLWCSKIPQTLLSKSALISVLPSDPAEGLWLLNL